MKFFDKSKKSEPSDENNITAPEGGKTESSPPSESGKKKAKSLYKKISNALVAVLFILVFIAFCSLLVQVVSGKQPSIFGYRIYFVLTDSMTPELEVNDAILSKTVNGADDAAKLKVGDVVTYVAEYGVQKGLTITHKVVEAPHYNAEYNRTVITTRGVKEGATLDPPVPVENVRGVMAKKLSFVGKFYKTLTSGVGLVGLLIVPLVLMLAVLIFRLITEITSKKKGQLSAEEEARKEEIEEEIKKKAIAEYIRQSEAEKEIAQKAVKDFIEEQKNKENP